MKKKLTQSMEDYLEAILILEEKNRVARVKDIAAHLDVKMPSVTVALKLLRDKNLIAYEKNSFIALTNEGLEVAKTTRKKHEILTNFFSTFLNITKEAEEIACQFEHIIDLNTANKFEKLISYFKHHNINSIDEINN